MTQRVDQRRPLFGEVWPEPPADFEGPSAVRRVPREAPEAPVRPPVDLEASPGEIVAGVLRRAHVAAVTALREAERAVGLLEVVDQTEAAKHRRAVDYAGRLVDILEAKRGQK